ncbi:unnamed protein product [Amoebophrya sp. A120]|nr:unnamed protein product [Amoebophrya sp. A120]|eukprot:GSA120T00011457001.1
MLPRCTRTKSGCSAEAPRLGAATRSATTATSWFLSTASVYARALTFCTCLCTTFDLVAAADFSDAPDEMLTSDATASIKKQSKVQTTSVHKNFAAEDHTNDGGNAMTILKLQKEVEALSQENALLMEQVSQKHEEGLRRDELAPATTSLSSLTNGKKHGAAQSTSFMDITAGEKQNLFPTGGGTNETMEIMEDENTELATLVNMLVRNGEASLAAQERLDDAVAARVRAELLEHKAKREWRNVSKVSKVGADADGDERTFSWLGLTATPCCGSFFGCGEREEFFRTDRVYDYRSSGAIQWLRQGQKQRAGQERVPGAPAGCGCEQRRKSHPDRNHHAHVQQLHFRAGRGPSRTRRET